MEGDAAVSFWITSQSMTKSLAEGLSDDRALRVAVIGNRRVETIKSGIETVRNRYETV
jgi:hypothetical protein